MAIFFYYGRLSSAQLDRWQAPMQCLLSTSTRSNRRHTGERSKTMDINPSLQRQIRNRSWIKGLGKKKHKRVNSFIAGSAFCLGPPNREPTDSEKRLRVYMSARTMARHGWCVDKAPGQNTQKSQCVFRRCPIAVPTKNCVFIQYPMRTG